MKRIVDLEKMRRLRKEKMSLEEMAKQIGFKSPNGYYYIESGKTKVTADKLAEVADILGVEIQELFMEIK